MKKSNLTPILQGFSSKIVSYQVDLARALKSPIAGIFASQLLHWTKYSEDGWIFRTQQQFEEETALTRRNQETARKILKKLNVIEEEKRGIPAKLYFKIKIDSFTELLENFYSDDSTNKDVQTVQTVMSEPSEQQCTNRTSANVQTVQTINKSNKSINNNILSIDEKNSNKDENGNFYLNGKPSSEEVQKEKEERKALLDDTVDKEAIHKEIKLKAWEHSKNKDWLNDSPSKEKYKNRTEIVKNWVESFIAVYEDRGLYESYFNILGKLVPFLNNKWENVNSYKWNELKESSYNGASKEVETVYKEKGTYSKKKTVKFDDNTKTTIYDFINKRVSKGAGSIFKTFVSKIEEGILTTDWNDLQKLIDTEFESYKTVS